VLVLLEIPGAVELLRRPDVGFALRNQTVMVVEAQSAAERAGLRPGDVLLRFDGKPATNYPALMAALYPLRVGDEAVVQVQRDGREIRLLLALEAKAARARLLDLLQSASAICFLFLGFVTYLKRDDALGRNFHLTCLLLAYPFLDLPSFPSAELMRFVEGLRDALLGFMPAVLLRFILNFPQGSEESSQRYRRQRWLLFPPAILAPAHVWSQFAGSSPIERMLVETLLAVTVLLFALYLLIAIIQFARKLRKRERWVSWSKLRLAALGLTAGLLPLLVATVLRQVDPTHRMPLDAASVLFLPLVPASFSVALLRSGAIDVAYLGRQTLISLLAGIPLVILALVVVFALAPHVDGSSRALIYGALVLGILALGLSATTTTRWIGHFVDRVFYPDQQRVRQIATELGRRLSEPRDPQRVAEILCRGVA
jgi:uncharacterized membrane protein